MAFVCGSIALARTQYAGLVQPSSFTPSKSISFSTVATPASARLTTSIAFKPICRINPGSASNDRRKYKIVKLNTSASSSASGTPAAAVFSKLKVGIYIGLWYALNIVYNISNKSCLNWLPLPWFVSWIQLVFGLCWVLPLWMFGLRKTPKLSWENIRNLVPISVCHVVGHVSTVIALGAVAVSFTHVVKSMEPFFNVVGSAVVLGSVFPIPVYLSLLPIVAGVIMASVSEVSFTWMGFISAMISNVAFTGRNIFSKVNMDKPVGENMDPVNLFGVIQVISTIMLLPFVLLMEGSKILPGIEAATQGVKAVVTAKKLWTSLFISGLFFQLYQEVAFLALNSVHPVTHAVANTMKRVVIIATSIIVFKNPITKANMMGSAIAIAGVLLYSLVKNYYDSQAKKPKTA